MSPVRSLLTLKLHMHRTGFPQALEIMENLENHEKSSMHGKIMEFENKPWIIMELYEIIRQNHQ